MLNDEQRTKFMLATAEYNTGWNGDVDESAALCSADQVTPTRDTVEQFVAEWGQPSETEDDMRIWENVQRRNGETRGTLFVMDFGEVRGVYFGN